MEKDDAPEKKNDTGNNANDEKTVKSDSRPNNNKSNAFFRSIVSFANSITSKNKPASAADTEKPLDFLSPIANSVVTRCSKVLLVTTEELRNQFEMELPDTLKEPSSYARNFLEFCSYRALPLLTAGPDYLSDKEFRRLNYDMMLAWEAPGVEKELLDTCQEKSPCSNQEKEDEDGWSLFYSSPTKMAVEVDNKKTVGVEAFMRIAPACTVIADIITVHNLFDVLTSSSCNRLHFLIYDKYLRTLDKVIKAVKNASGSHSTSNFQLAEGEFILDVDGTVPTQPVLQHIGKSAWPGRLTVSNYALYFESLGVGLYDKALRYDLALDMKQVIRPELTGPLGARIFDKAVMYKSTSMEEPVYFEFPEFKGNSRRDYWLDVCLEVLRAHRFIRKFDLEGVQKSEALARATLGIFRYRAVREAFSLFSTNYKTLLSFNLAESLPGGDCILETLSSSLAILNSNTRQHDSTEALVAKQGLRLPLAVISLHKHGITTEKGTNVDGAANYAALDVCVGEIHPLEKAVKNSKENTDRAQAAQATVDQVKVEGIDTNLAILKELLFPLIGLLNRLRDLAAWQQPLKSTMFMILVSYIMHRGWIRYIVSSFFVILAVLVLWHRTINKRRSMEAFKITVPPNKNAVEQLLTLQDAISQLESLIQAGNIVLLKFRALLFAALPQATDGVAVFLVFLAILFALVPLRYLTLSVFLESFTREMPLRKESSDRLLRRIREWWIRIPAAPVHLIKPDDKKRK